MIFTLEKLIDSIIGMLKQNFPGIKAYSNPNQQGTKPPCFFVFFMPSSMESEMDRRIRRVIGIDIVYLTKRNIPDAYDQLNAVADKLDEVMERIAYVNGEESAELWPSEREWKIDDGELHYQFTLKVIVSNPDNSPIIDSMEQYKGGVKDAENTVQDG
ncbi:DUF6838 family protein [Hungatella hathewayi]|uniref:phage tail terminator family protein n=1 Tax=Hungatella hathewayi TaxID=154046 RepID=UPI0032C146E6